MPVSWSGPFLGKSKIPAFRARVKAEALNVLNDSRFLIVRFLQKEEVVPDFFWFVLE